jgi:hypothetical protein
MIDRGLIGQGCKVSGHPELGIQIRRYEADLQASIARLEQAHFSFLFK